MKKKSPRVILCSIAEKNIVLSVLDKNNQHSCDWMYLGENLADRKEIEGALKHRGRPFAYGGDLQKIARELRQNFIEYIGSLTERYHSFHWWTLYLSEKNPYQSKFFLYCCYVFIIKRFLETHDTPEPLVIFVENRSLEQCIYTNLTEMGYDCKEIASPHIHTVADGIRDCSEIIMRKTFFIVTSLVKILIAKYHCRFSSGELNRNQAESVFIITWLDHRSFSDYRYQDPYFGDLPDLLKQTGKNVTIVPHILGSTGIFGNLGAYRRWLIEMKKSGEQFLVPEAFLNISDIFRVFFSEMRKYPRKRSYPRFENLEVSELIFDECRKNWIDVRSSSLRLVYYFIKNIKTKDLKVDTVIYTFENRIRDKILCWALREYYPSTFIIGYQHATVSLMLLDHFFSQRELPYLPFPDRLVTNGRYTEALFKHAGYDIAKVMCGGAFRFHHLFTELHQSPLPWRSHQPRHTLLVTLPSGLYDACELLEKFLTAFSDDEQYTILLKIHPILPLPKILKTIGLALLPGNFTVSARPLDQLIGESDIVVYTLSSTCIEALALGVPALHVGSDLFIDMDVLEEKKDCRYEVPSGGSLRDVVRSILMTDEATMMRNRQRWKEAVLDILEPVSEKTIEVFDRNFTGAIADDNEIP